MENLITFMANPDPWPTLVATAVAHYQFETIHPFEDGNGRMGRLLIPLLLLAHGVIDRPLVYLSDYLDAHRDQYFDMLKAVSCRGDWERWLLFYLEAVRATAESAIRRIKAIVSLGIQYRGRILEASRSQAPLAALDAVMEKVFVTAAEVQTAAHCSNPTARAAIETLVSLGILQVEPRSYPARWVASELIRVAYDA